MHSAKRRVILCRRNRPKIFRTLCPTFNNPIIVTRNTSVMIIPLHHRGAYNVHMAECLSLVYTSAPNGSRTKCTYVTANLCCVIRNWFAYRLPRPKFVSFLREHKENWMRRVSFPCIRCPLLASGLQKIN